MLEPCPKQRELSPFSASLWHRARASEERHAVRQVQRGGGNRHAIDLRQEARPIRAPRDDRADPGHEDGRLGRLTPPARGHGGEELFLSGSHDAYAGPPKLGLGNSIGSERPEHHARQLHRVIPSFQEQAVERHAGQRADLMAYVGTSLEEELFKALQVGRLDGIEEPEAEGLGERRTNPVEHRKPAGRVAPCGTGPGLQMPARFDKSDVAASLCVLETPGQRDIREGISQGQWISIVFSGAPVHPDLEETVAFHDSIIAEGGKALVGYNTAKTLANAVLLSEIPTTYDKKEQRQVNSGNLLLRGVPGVGKTFFGVILAAISNAKFVRLQGRADLQPTEVVGFQMINPATGEMVTEFGPLAEGEVILLDEINRIPLKSQSAFLEGLQDRTVTVGKTTYELPAFSFAIATMNPIELGQGTFPLSEAATDRFAIMVNIGYLPPEEERKLVNFDFKRIRLSPLMAKERIIALRASVNEHVYLHERLGDYIQRLVAATRPYNPEIDWRVHSPSELVEHGVDLGASPRAIICWGRLAKVWALLASRIWHRTS
jgi:MoxR-like ATPase